MKNDRILMKNDPILSIIIVPRKKTLKDTYNGRKESETSYMDKISVIGRLSYMLKITPTQSLTATFRVSTLLTDHVNS